MKVIKVYNLPLGDKIMVSFEGNQPSPTNVYEILSRFLDKLTQDNNLFPVCYDKWPKVFNRKKEKAWNDIIKVRND